MSGIYILLLAGICGRIDGRAGGRQGRGVRLLCDAMNSIALKPGGNTDLASLFPRGALDTPQYPAEYLQPQPHRITRSVCTCDVLAENERCSVGK